jgi:DNA-directed RNA polymerase sigma subunit (sigma70/sigma32)
MENFNFEHKLAKLLAQKDRIADMKRLREQGWTLKKIGDKYGLTKARVHQILGTGSKQEVAK